VYFCVLLFIGIYLGFWYAQNFARAKPQIVPFNRLYASDWCIKKPALKLTRTGKDTNVISMGDWYSKVPTSDSVSLFYRRSYIYFERFLC